MPRSPRPVTRLRSHLDYPEPDVTMGPVASKFFSALRIRNFSLVVAAGSMSQLGDRLTHMLLITVIALSNPGKLLAYSASSMVFVLPSLLIAPIAGVLVDRWDKRRVLGYTHIIQSTLLFVSAFLVIATGNFVPFWLALFIFFGLDVFNNTSIPALIPELVPEDDLLAANSANLTFNRIATVLGMVAGGFLVRWAGWRYGLIINSATHLTAGLLALLITGTFISHRATVPGRTDPAPRENAWDLSVRAFRRLFADIAEVVRVVGRNRLVAFVMLSIVVTVFISSVSYTVLIFLVQQVLGLGTGGVGIFAGTLAVGMIVGAASLGFVKRKVDRPMVIVGVVTFYGVLFLASPPLLSVAFIAVAAVVAGVAFSWLGIVQNTMLQEAVPDGIRGRIFSTREFITNAAFLLTTLFIGALGDLTSYKIVLVALGGVLCLLGAAGYLLARKLPSPAAGGKSEALSTKS